MFNAANKWNKSNYGYYQSDDCNAFIDFLIHAIELPPHFWFPTKQSFRSCYQSTTNYSANSNSACIFPEQSISELCEEIYQLLKTPRTFSSGQSRGVKYTKLCIKGDSSDLIMQCHSIYSNWMQISWIFSLVYRLIFHHVRI